MSENKTESKWEELIKTYPVIRDLDLGQKATMSLVSLLMGVEKEAKEEERKIHDNDLQILQDFVSNKIKSLATSESYASVVASIYKYITDLRIRNIK